MTDEAGKTYTDLIVAELRASLEKLRQVTASFVSVAESVEADDPKLASLLAAGALCATAARCLTGGADPAEYAELRRFLGETPDFAAELTRLVGYAERVSVRVREQKAGAVAKLERPLLVLPERYKNRWKGLSPEDRAPGN